MKLNYEIQLSDKVQGVFAWHDLGLVLVPRHMPMDEVKQALDSIADERWGVSFAEGNPLRSALYGMNEPKPVEIE